eukprot:8607336-Lingulodinium_polyedra.AAC.1
MTQQPAPSHPASHNGGIELPQPPSCGTPGQTGRATRGGLSRRSCPGRPAGCGRRRSPWGWSGRWLQGSHLPRLQSCSERLQPSCRAGCPKTSLRRGSCS